MSGKGPAESPADPQVAAAVKMWKVTPSLTVNQVMLAAEFTADDATCAQQADVDQVWMLKYSLSKYSSSKYSLSTYSSIKSSSGE